MAVPLTLKLIAKTAGFQKSLLAAEKSFNKTTKKFLGDAQAFRKIGTEFKNMGSKITIGLGVPIGAAAFAVLKAAGNFEEAFIGVKKTVNATQTEFNQLEADIKAMAKELPFSAIEIANVAEKAGQLGLKAPEIAAFTKVVLDFSTSTNIAAEDAAISLARLAEISGIGTENISNLASAIVALGNDIKGDELEIIETTLNFAAMGKEIGLTAAQVVAFGASVVESGAKSEAGGTAMSELFRRVAISVAESGAELNSIAEISGTTAAAFKKSFEQDANTAIRTLLEGISKIPGAAGDTLIAMGEIDFTGRRLGGTILALADQFANVKKNSDLATKEFALNSASTIEAEKRYASFNSKVKILAGRLRLAAIEMGENLLPIFDKFSKEVIIPLIEKISDLAKEFSKLSPDDKEFFVELAAALVLSGPILVGLGFMISSIQAIGTAALFVFWGPLGIISAIAALTFWLLKATGGWEAFSKQADNTTKKLEKSIETHGFFTTVLATIVKNLAGSAVEYESVAETIDLATDAAIEMGGAAVDSIAGFLSFSSELETLKKESGEFFDSVVDGSKDMVDAFKEKKEAVVALSREELSELRQIEADRLAMLKQADRERFNAIRKTLDDRARTKVKARNEEKKGAEILATALGDIQEQLGRDIQKAAQEEFDFKEKLKDLAVVGVLQASNVIKGAISGQIASSSKVWQTFATSVVDIFALLAAKALGAAVTISASMAFATAGISLVIGLLASVFGGRKKKDTQVRDAVDNFLKEVKRSLEDFESQILTTLQMVTRNANRARELAKVIPERLQVLSKLQNLSPQTSNGKLAFRVLFDETTELFKRLQNLGSNVANPRARFRDLIKEQILLLTKNAQETLDLINAEFDLKKANINEILNLLQRQKDFIKDINSSITDVDRAFFTKEQLFTAQKGDVAALKDALLTATGETKIGLLADLKSALLTSFQTAKDIFAPKNQAEIDALRADQKTLQAKTNQTASDIALQQTIANKIEALTIQDLQSEEMLVGWQKSVISGLEQVRTSGITAFDKLVDLQLRELGISEDSLVTEKDMKALLLGITSASFLAVNLLGDIAKNPTAADPTSISNLSKALSLIFTAPNSSVPLASALATAQSLPMLAQGGIVNRPTQAIIGEAGPEAIIPLGSGLLGSTTINVTLNVKDAASLSTTKWEQILKENLGTAMERINRQGFRSSLQPKVVV